MKKNIDGLSQIREKSGCADLKKRSKDREGEGAVRREEGERKGDVTIGKRRDCQVYKAGSVLICPLINCTAL